MINKQRSSITTTGKRSDGYPPGGNGKLLLRQVNFSEHPPFGRGALELLVLALALVLLPTLWEVSKFITETRFSFFSCTWTVSRATHN
jgi:hypothetical protein